MQLRTLITLHAAAATKTPERLPPDVRAREALKLVDSFGECDEKTRRQAAYYALHPEQFWGDAHCEQVLDVVAKHCTKGLGLDIGANVGATLNAVRRCAGGEGCTGVIAFEPNPANLPLLREAAEDDVIIVERAASDVADVTVAFNLPTGTDQVCYLVVFRVDGVPRRPGSTSLPKRRATPSAASPHLKMRTPSTSSRRPWIMKSKVG